MDFMLDRLTDKVEFFQAYDLASLEKTIAVKIDDNKAMLLEVNAVQHNVVFDPRAEKMLYSATVHFKAKK
ncbi:DUF2536 family protein [Paenibacillus xanthanilyticus]|uniref:DUF2536 family protein n=1 Tax=Paenibacillus xanthanilyticus TaxID=1783531 RepID=A0ABV8JZD6_9BACL